MSNFDLLIGLAPLLLLAVFAIVVVWRGMRDEPDGSENEAKGGGPQWKIWE